MIIVTLDGKIMSPGEDYSFDDGSFDDGTIPKFTNKLKDGSVVQVIDTKDDTRHVYEVINNEISVLNCERFFI